MRPFIYDRASSEVTAIRAASMLAQLPWSRAARQSNIWPAAQRSST